MACQGWSVFRPAFDARDDQDGNLLHVLQPGRRGTSSRRFAGGPIAARSRFGDVGTAAPRAFFWSGRRTTTKCIPAGCHRSLLGRRGRSTPATVPLDSARPNPGCLRTVRVVDNSLSAFLGQASHFRTRSLYWRVELSIRHHASTDGNIVCHLIIAALASSLTVNQRSIEGSRCPIAATSIPSSVPRLTR